MWYYCRTGFICIKCCHNYIAAFSSFYCTWNHTVMLVASKKISQNVFTLRPRKHVLCLTNPGSMNKILCTEYFSKICIEMNWNELNFTFYFILFTFVLIYMYCMYMYLSLIHIWRCRRIERCRSRWSPYH